MLEDQISWAAKLLSPQNWPCTDGVQVFVAFVSLININF